MRERSAQENAYVTGLLNAERAGYHVGFEGRSERCPYRRTDMMLSWAEGQKRGAAERRKLKLWNQQHGLCHWCNCEMIHWTDSRRNRIATVDHLRDRYDPTTRGDPNPDREQRWVLACWECNQRRSDERTAARPEDLWRRSGRHAAQGDTKRRTNRLDMR